MPVSAVVSVSPEEFASRSVPDQSPMYSNAHHQMPATSLQYRSSPYQMSLVQQPPPPPPPPTAPSSAPTSSGFATQPSSPHFSHPASQSGYTSMRGSTDPTNYRHSNVRRLSVPEALQHVQPMTPLQSLPPSVLDISGNRARSFSNSSTNSTSSITAAETQQQNLLTSSTRLSHLMQAQQPMLTQPAPSAVRSAQSEFAQSAIHYSPPVRYDSQISPESPRQYHHSTSYSGGASTGYSYALDTRHPSYANQQHSTPLGYVQAYTAGLPLPLPSVYQMSQTTASPGSAETPSGLERDLHPQTVQIPGSDQLPSGQYPNFSGFPAAEQSSKRSHTPSSQSPPTRPGISISNLLDPSGETIPSRPNNEQ